MDLTDKKVLITGSSGFIGSHLTEKLVKLGCNVRAFVKYNFKNDWGWLEHSEVKDEVEVYTGDIRDYDAVYDALDGVDVVFHLAALIGIPYSYKSPLAYIKTNVEGTYNILQVSRQRELEKVIITSTSETYGTAQYVPIDEEHPLVGQSPYSASKIAADQLAISYHRSFEMPIAIARPFNTYGPRQSARAIIPTIITQILNGQKEIKLGNLSPTRDFNYVKDTVNGFIEIAKSQETIGEVTNIGSNYEISMQDTVDLIIELIGEEVEILTDEKRVRPDKSEVDRLLCNNSKIKKITNWKPRYTLEEGLQETINWVSNNLHFYKPEIYNV
ncbi:NAD-dependent 4,6-dehydratase LegB [Selenihalanaerobacter shriftii]|uniref:NAD dependent epimerase/dehydratase, LLPSF_EDH_00030 family n=1 Tax=Selenihalanaerobacter shriftii TaxID=142842 RepID=A0A1T4KMI1_9FIRM|nr:NAD-dependent 4,6-dehydratase LegB [Selenihalanaerobacter shriftii]SJZ43599.1 NAD dependent epimerase/dehydratase, LLPSF_EDH_00030 family [Selenihalanaerobacter shriftii]